MKKFFAIAAVAMMALTANAQVYVGGSVSFNSEKADADAEAMNIFKIAPEVGYNLNEDWAVGAVLDITSYNKQAGDKTTFAVSPYARYTFCKSGMVNLFIDGGVRYESYGEDRGSEFGVGVRPGIALNVNDKISLVAKTGYLGYTSKDKEAGEGSKFGIGIDNSNISFGVYYNF